MKKKTLALFMAIAMGATLLNGCATVGGEVKQTEAPAEAVKTENPAESGTPEDKVFKIGICQQLEHPALDAATEGFRAALVEKLGEDKVEFDYQNAQGEQANCATIATKFVNDKVDLIMANATTALQACAAATADIPVIGTSVTDFVSAGVVESNEAPGRNVTGASDLAPIDQQIELLKTLVPEAKAAGIVYCSAEANSVFQADTAEAELTKAGITVSRYTVADSNDIQQVVTKAVSECDVLYIPTDNTLADNMQVVKNVTVPAKIPVIAGEENMCAGGGLATLSISYYSLGYNAGLMAYEILVNGADPAAMPIEYADETTVKYNAEIAEALGMTMPEDMVAIEKED